MLFKRSRILVPTGQSSISVQLNGGLGNQLFQYGAALSQANRLGVSVSLNTSQLGREGSRDLEVLDFAVSSEIFAKRDRPFAKFKENEFAYDGRIESIGAGTELVGYFQSWKYLERSKVDLVTSLRNRAVLTGLPAPARPFIALQVRRGDYLDKAQLAFHGLCSFEYYERALAISRSLIGDLPAVVFCDDLDTAMQFSEALPRAVADVPMDGEKPAETMSRLAQASGHVIANSSFGWWGAWLSSSSQFTIAPRPWFGDRSIDTADLLPPEWLTIDRS
jgi:hypothetical protein